MFLSNASRFSFLIVDVLEIRGLIEIILISYETHTYSIENPGQRYITLGEFFLGTVYTLDISFTTIISDRWPLYLTSCFYRETIP